MISAYTGTDVRAAEEPLLARGEGPALMQRAAHGLYSEAVRCLRGAGRRVYGADVVILAGAGNNGGDALYAGARLASRGARVTAVLVADRAHPDGLAELRRRGGAVLDRPAAGAAARCAAADLVIDGLLGTGGKGGLRTAAAEIAASLSPARETGTGPIILAVDLPSGIDADTGAAVGPHVRADATVTFGAWKTGLMAGPGAAAAGRVECVDIGLGPFLPAPSLYRLEAADIAARLYRPRPEDHKYSRGVLGVAAGSATYPGAAILAVGAALATGVGMVRYLGPAEVGRTVNITHPEAVCSDAQVADTHVQAWAAGPGAGADAEQRRRAEAAMAAGIPAVIDADALSAVRPGLDRRIVLTPHAGELARLLTALDHPVDRAEVEADPLSHARRAAGLTGATVLLKGWATLCTDPDGPAYSQAEGTPQLAAAGSGDTLSGILGALLATDHTPQDARGPGHYARLAAAAAGLHGLAGRLQAAGGPVEPSQLPAAIRTVVGGLGARTGGPVRRGKV